MLIRFKKNVSPPPLFFFSGEGIVGLESRGEYFGSDKILFLLPPFFFLCSLAAGGSLILKRASLPSPPPERKISR